jgi:hypothetical protein
MTLFEPDGSLMQVKVLDRRSNPLALSHPPEITGCGLRDQGGPTQPSTRMQRSPALQIMENSECVLSTP